MGFISISKIILIITLPIILFLLAANFSGFDSAFYKEKFSQYGIGGGVGGADSMHEKVMNFLNGESDELPSQFNERERQHLIDVKRITRLLTIALYALIAIFAALLIGSAAILKANNYITGFVGRVMVFGGALTVILALALFFFISSDFSSFFEFFHRLFFESGTYTFDPAKETIVKLYPEKLFAELGARISKWVLAASAAVILAGALLMLKSKSKKNK